MRDDRPEALRARPDAVEVPGADVPAAADWPRRNDSRSPAELTRRLDSLPDGHPSSRYEADGSLRDSPLRLSDLETPPPEDEASSDADIAESRPETVSPDDANRPADIRPYTDAEWADHITEVRTRLDDAEKLGLATNLQYTVGPDKKEWSAERNRVQGALIAALYEQAQDVPCEGRAIIAGGLGGAGKTTVLSEHAGIDRSQYLTINPDNIKEEMARRGLIPEVEGLSPMEASELAHEESSYIAKRLALRASADGKNLIWDITMSTLESTKSRISELRSTGYAVDGIFVDIPVDTSIRRTDARHREGHEAYRAGIGLGGRCVPPEVIRAQADPDWGCNNRKTFEEVTHLFDHWSRYDNSMDGRPPVLVQADSPADTKEERA
jgi:predicted ABC-type ATPase